MNKSMNMGRRLSAGEPGTKKMVKKYGDNLICVRYRYDWDKRIKYKTVEIIEDMGIWDKADRKVEIMISYNEVELRAKVKASGGIWNREKKLWEINYSKARDRIVRKGQG